MIYYYNQDTKEPLKESDIDEEKGSLWLLNDMVYYQYVNDNWVVVDGNGKILDYPVDVDTSDFDKDQLYPEQFTIGYFHPYTEEDYQRMKDMEEEFKKSEQEQKEKEEKFNSLPNRVDGLEDTQDDIVLLLADIIGNN